MTRRAIVVANGDLPTPHITRARLDGWQEALVIAADGGSCHALALGLHVDVVIGDQDSLDVALHQQLVAQGVHFETASSHKDESDLELALLYAARQGVDELAILGAVGKRLDMSLANISLLALPALEGLKVRLWAGDQTAWLITPPGESLHGHPGDTLSLIPLGGVAEGVRTAGLEYPLCDETLWFGPARGVSNVLCAERADVRLRAGLLLAVHTPGRA
jgi:thiamine pyrophosphokinase